MHIEQECIYRTHNSPFQSTLDIQINFITLESFIRLQAHTLFNPRSFKYRLGRNLF